MQQADEILDLLNEKLGSDALKWQGDHASIRFEDGAVVDIVKLDAQTVELVSLFDQFKGVLTPDMYKTLLVANYQGAMAGPFRLSITPADETIAVCGRVDVTAHDADSFEALVTSFVQVVTFWNSAEAMVFMMSDEAHEQSMPAGHEEGLIVTKI